MRGLAGRIPARAADRTLAAALATLGAVNALAVHGTGGGALVDAAGIGLISLPLALRRQRPLASVSGVAILLVLNEFLLSSPPEIAAATVTVVIAMYSAGAHLETMPAAAGLGVGLAAAAATAAHYNPDDLVAPLAVFGIAPWATGRLLRDHTMLARTLAENTERAELAREAETRRAVERERARVALDLHDALAHNLSVMVIQAAAASRVAVRDAEGARRAAGLIARTGRETLAELRQLLGPVRHGDPEALAGTAGLGDLERLARRARRAGLEVTVRIVGEVQALPPGADLAAYRVVQEALTNTLKHAPGARAELLVTHGEDEVEIEILDDGPGPAGMAAKLGGGGHGLLGMSERVSLYGGQVETGRRRGGGFGVRARIPRRHRVPA